MTKARRIANFGGAFVDLSDSPGAYSGQGGKLVGVNAGATGLEYKGAANTFIGLTDVPVAFPGVGSPRIGLRQNAAGTALEFGMQQPRTYRTAPGAEGGPSVLITLGAFTVWVDIFKYALPISLAVGDILMVEAQTEIRNDAAFNVEFVTSLFVSNASSIATGTDIDGTGVYIGELNGHDVDPTMHYFDTPKSGVITIGTAIATPYVYFRVRCRSTAAVGTDYANIMNGYGHMTMTVFPRSGI